MWHIVASHTCTFTAFWNAFNLLQLSLYRSFHLTEIDNKNKLQKKNSTIIFTINSPAHYRNFWNIRYLSSKNMFNGLMSVASTIAEVETQTRNVWYIIYFKFLPTSNT